MLPASWRQKSKRIMDRFESYELYPFNVEGQIVLGDKFGLIKIFRSQDERIILLCHNKYQTIEKPTPASIANLDAALGFVLDIGIKRNGLLVRDGFYLGESTQPQSQKVIKQASFDASVFETVVSIINHYYQSNQRDKESLAVRTNFLLDTYNNCRLLYPNFYSESYLGLLRIIDATSNSSRAINFALAAARISSTLNHDVYEKIAAVGALEVRLGIADSLFLDCLGGKKGHISSKEKAQMRTLDPQAKLIFSCFYSAYQYRNKFVHQGFPFPEIGGFGRGQGDDSGLSYLDSVLGMLLVRSHSPIGEYRPTDNFDMHLILEDVVKDRSEVEAFRQVYFLLLPSWYFVRRFAHGAIQNLIDKMNKEVLAPLEAQVV
jgi:hypothetical protein